MYSAHPGAPPSSLQSVSQFGQVLGAHDFMGTPVHTDRFKLIKLIPVFSSDWLKHTIGTPPWPAMWKGKPVKASGNIFLHL